MKVRRFEWQGAEETAASLREWAAEESPSVDVEPIEEEVLEGGDEAVLRLTARFDAPAASLDSLRVDGGETSSALSVLEPELREAMEVAIANVRQVAEADQRRQLDRALDLDQFDPAAGRLEIALGDPRVLGRDPHHSQPPLRFRQAVVPGLGGEDHPAAAEAEGEELEDGAIRLL